MIDRRDFLPESFRNFADIDEARAMPSGDYSISQTKTVDLMLDILNIEAGMRTLEVGAGTGYHAARLAELGAEVVSIERLAHAAEFAKQNLSSLGTPGATIVHGDGFAGSLQHAPFDRISVTCAVSAFPRTLFDQLRVGGVMLYPACIAGSNPGERPDILLRIRKRRELPQSFDREAVDAAMQIEQHDAVYFMRGVSDLLPSSMQRSDFGYGVSYDVERVRPDIGFVELFYKENEGPPLHYHRFEDERFQVTEGSFEFRVGEDRFILEKGQSCIARRNVSHKFRARGSGQNSLFISLTPGGSERYFPEIADYWRRPDANYEVSGAINAKYGMVLLESSEHARTHF